MKTYTDLVIFLIGVILIMSFFTAIKLYKDHQQDVKLQEKTAVTRVIYQKNKKRALERRNERLKHELAVNIRQKQALKERAIMKETPNVRKVEPIQGGAVGVASWYGPGLHGNTTASGEVFDMNAMTCAHKYYAFGTMLEITNLANNQSVVVKVNDRGPFIAGRHIDLSRAAFEKIASLGSGTINIKIKEL